MDTIEDKELEPLKTGVLSALQKDGSLNEIRAQLRAHVFRVCDNSYDNSKLQNKDKDIKQNEENILINQLIREYFKFNGYKHSLNIFDCETGEQNDSDIDRDLVQNKLKFNSKDEEINKLPLLNSVIKHFLERKTND